MAPVKKASAKHTPAKAAKKAAAPKAHHKKRAETFSVYIYRVLKQVHPETGISKKSMSIMNSFINDIFEKVASEVNAKNTGVELKGLKQSINPFDEIAVEEALKMREAGILKEVVAITIGPKQ